MSDSCSKDLCILMSMDHAMRPSAIGSSRAPTLSMIQMAGAASLFRCLAAKGAPLVHPLTDETWEWRRFVVRDLIGADVDVVQFLAAPAKGAE